MKMILSCLILAVCTGGTVPAEAQQRHSWGDQGNGCYANPILPSDYSDPDVIRVGDTFYMVASDFHFMGMQILSSRDLVNWKVLTQLYNRLDEPGWNENKHYAGGSWAPSIRWHAGRFWVYFCTPDEGLFMTTAERPEGPWAPLTCVRRIAKWEDPCPFWDTDGRAYLGHSVHGAGPIIVHRMSEDGTRLLDEGVTVYRGPVAEGTKFYHRDGWYYLCIPEGGVSQGWQTCLRARSVYGPYERRVVLERGSTSINGPHQGALVDTPDGTWWFLHFQQCSPLGRIVHLQPVTWQDGWPFIGQDPDGNGIGEPVATWRKPVLTATPANDSIQVSDPFSGSRLSPIWQWNHNPDNAAWSLTERPGMLTLHAGKSSHFKGARNTLTQKLMGYRTRATVTMDISRMSDGQRTGMAVMGRINHLAGVMRQGRQIYLYEESNDTILWQKPYRGSRLTVFLDADTRANAFRFGFLRGQEVVPFPARTFPMQDGFWKGARYALYCYNTKQARGLARFDDFTWTDRE